MSSRKSAAEKRREVIVLGSGLSINGLTAEDVAYINTCEAVIAVNKFMAFYKMTGIVPNYVYYVDHIEGCSPFIDHIFRTCERDGLRDLTFILSKKYGSRVRTSAAAYWYKYATVRLLRLSDKTVFRAPGYWKYQFIEREHWLAGSNWATRLDEKLFHFRGSLTSVLNYVTIAFPGRPVKLVGNDFNSPGYFYQGELEQLDFEWRDWTAPIVDKEKRHFSAVEFEGTTMFDKFPVLIDHMTHTNNPLYCCTATSLLVEKDLVPFVPVTGEV